jgi:hypothetical protein
VTAQKISAWLAIVLSVIGAPLKVLRVLRQPEPLTSAAYDYIAIVILVIGAVMVLRKGPGLWLAAGWGFGCAMFYGSLGGHYWSLTHGAADLGFERTMVTGDVIGLALNIVGLGLCLAGARRELRAGA